MTCCDESILYLGNDLVSAAGKLKPGVEFSVTYDSVRADGDVTMKGVPTKVKYRDDSLSVYFTRKDGQEVAVYGDGEVHSIGSHHPYNGQMKTVKVKEK